MGRDQHGGGEDEEEVKMTFDEFECPECDANNPWDDGFTDGDEIRCHYCGMAYVVKISDSGKLKLKPD